MGFAWTVVHCVAWFGFPAVRRPVEELLGHRAVPHLLTVSAGLTVLFLAGWVIAFMARTTEEPITRSGLRKWMLSGAKVGRVRTGIDFLLFFGIGRLQEL